MHYVYSLHEKKNCVHDSDSIIVSVFFFLSPHSIDCLLLRVCVPPGTPWFLFLFCFECVTFPHVLHRKQYDTQSAGWFRA